MLLNRVMKKFNSQISILITEEEDNLCPPPSAKQ